MITDEVYQMDVLNLAFLGDAVYELLVREMISTKNMRVNELHNEAIHFVSANSQCADLDVIWEDLDEREQTIVKRARNKRLHAPKHTKPQVYTLATGFEALFGALYLSGEKERIAGLFEKIKENKYGNNR